MARKKSRKFKSNRERIKERAENREKSTGGGLRYNLPEGVEWYEPGGKKNLISIVPYEVMVNDNPETEKGELDYRRQIFVHYNIGPDGEAVLCRKTIGKKCPICERARKLNWDEDEEEIRALRPSKRELYNIINLDEDEEEILLAEIAYANFGEMLDDEIESADPDDIILGIADLEERPHLRVRWKKDKYAGNTFMKVSKIDAIEGDDLDEDILDEVYNLDEILNVLSYDDLEALFLGGDVDEDEEDEEDEKPRKKKKSKKSRKKKYIKDVDEDDVPFDDEDEDEEDEKPRKKKKSKSSKKKKSKKKKDDDNEFGRTCPHGHRYAYDCDETEDCDDCALWDFCVEDQDAVQ